MYPPDQLGAIVRLTNIQLRMKNKKETTMGEVVRFLGVLILATKYQFNNRQDLWTTEPKTRLIAAPNFGIKTGMSRNRFDDIWSCMRWSDQLQHKPEGMSWETYRWQLVEDHVRLFNEYRERNFVPSEMICVDESISRWYGQGGALDQPWPSNVCCNRSEAGEWL
jgi:hypothetical protein